MVYLDDRMLLLVTGLVALSSLAACLWRYWFYFRQLVRLCSCKKAVKKYDAIPEYWENAGKSLNGALDRSSPDYFDDIYPVQLQNREVLQRFLNETSTNEEIHFQLVRAVRVEHSRLWSEYQSLAQEIGRRKLSFKGHGAPTTNQALERCWKLGWLVWWLCSCLGWGYLWSLPFPWNWATFCIKDCWGWFPREECQPCWKKVWNRWLLFRRSRSCRQICGRRRGTLQRLPCDCFCVGSFWVLSIAPRCSGKRIQQQKLPGMDVIPSWQSPMVLYTVNLWCWMVVKSIRNMRWSMNVKELTSGCALHQSIDIGQVNHQPIDLREGKGSLMWVSCPPTGFMLCSRQAFSTRHILTSQMKAVMDDLLSKTWLSDLVFRQSSPVSPPSPLHPLRTSRSHRSPYIDVTVALRCLKVVRVEDSEMWADYRAAQNAVAARGQLERIDVHTLEALPQREHRRLKEELNEVYLFYGTSPQNVMYIAHHGFPVTMSGDMFGFDFGEGAYLHEDASEADKRSSDDKNGYYQGYYAMLLCRVTLGAVQILQKPDADAHLRVGPEKDFDSTVGSYGDGHSGVGMLRREFVVTERSQIYPEYAIIYERANREQAKVQVWWATRSLERPRRGWANLTAVMRFAPSDWAYGLLFPVVVCKLHMVSKCSRSPHQQAATSIFQCDDSWRCTLFWCASHKERDYAEEDETAS